MESVYIHIPFCSSICSYCDFTKLIYNESWTMSYLNSLKKEIQERYKNEVIKTLYIGGGTPSVLSIKELIYLFEILKLLDLSQVEEFTFECNIDSLSLEKLILLKKNNVNRLSIGIQSFDENNLNILGISRLNSKVFELIDIISNIGFNNINLDLIYAIPGESLETLNKDIDIILSLNPNHISCYSLMIEPNTKLYIDKYNTIDEDLDYEMYKIIEDRLKSNGYNHYEISNYSKDRNESKHNLVYWNNQEYYGFGLGASSYIGDYRIDNTKNLSNYLNNIFEENRIDVSKDKIKYELMLGFRKINGINIEAFNKKYDVNIIDLLEKFIKENKIEYKDGFVFITEEWIYKMNEILVELI